MLILLLGNSASAATIKVPDEYPMIQWAIDNATAGNTIEVYSGTYYENVNVNQQLALRGVDTGGGKPVVDAGGSGNAITLSAGNSLIEGFTVINAQDGILIISSDNIVKSNNATTNTHSGIEVFCDWSILNTCSSNILIDNIFSNNQIGFNLDANASKSGYYPHDNNISNNIASNNSWGFYLSRGNSSILFGNKVLNNSNGIYLENYFLGMGGDCVLCVSSGYNTLSYNTVSNNGNGIFLLSQDNMLFDNNISNNTNIGIYIETISKYWDSTSFLQTYIEEGYNDLINNNVSNNGNGIYIEYSSSNTLINNSVLNNNNGIILNNSNLIYNNYFSNSNNANDSGNNILNTTKTSGTNIVGGPYLGGNVWAYPNGTGFSQICADLDIDGICDLPYLLDSNNTDYLPLAYNIMPPAGVTNLTNNSYAMNYINWT